MKKFNILIIFMGMSACRTPEPECLPHLDFELAFPDSVYTAPCDIEFIDLSTCAEPYWVINPNSGRSVFVEGAPENHKIFHFDSAGTYLVHLEAHYNFQEIWGIEVSEEKTIVIE
jgi:hypothetical protein